MKAKNPKILLLSYKFPPYKGVGARRWTKFANEFLTNEHDLTVVCNDWKNSGETYYFDDKFNVNVIRLKDPIYVLLNYSKSLRRVINKITNQILKIVTATDEAYIFYLFNFYKLKRLIKNQKYDCIVSTGAPFSTNYFAAKFKKCFPDIILIQEFRDVWIPLYFSEHPGRTKEHPIYKKEVKMEQFAIEQADAVVAVTEGCIDRIKELHAQKNIFHVIKNGFDINDLKHIKSTSNYKSLFLTNKITISHFGTAGFGRDTEFVNFLKSIKESLIKCDNIVFYFFGHFGADNRKIIDEDIFLSSIVTFYEYISPDEIHLLMRLTDIHLVLNDNIFYYTMGSKFYDALLHKKPILLISKRSALSHLIEKYKLGWITENNKTENLQVLNSVLKYDKNNFNYSDDFVWEEYSVQNRSKEYYQLIENIYNKKHI